mgnify:CR=1 FL=1
MWQLSISPLSLTLHKEWMEMIERENVVRKEDKIEIYVGKGESKVRLTNVKTRVMYKCKRGKERRRPVVEKVWNKVMNGMDVENM